MMSATYYGLDRAPSRAADEYRAARGRLTLAVLWLAGLIAWGLFSYLVEPQQVGQSDLAPAPAAQAFDGRGKWTGY
jgi:hypothetical protein